MSKELGKDASKFLEEQVSSTNVKILKKLFKAGVKKDEVAGSLALIMKDKTEPLESRVDAALILFEEYADPDAKDVLLSLAKGM